jgi:hypothetical protein
MINNIIKMNDNVYLIKRILNENTTEESAVRIHHTYETDTLLRDKSGKWFCCNLVKEVEFTDVELIHTESRQSLFDGSMEIGDTGGLG